MSTSETILELTKIRSSFRSISEADEIRAAYDTLTLQESRELARCAIRLEQWEPAEEILLNLACVFPGSLDGLHNELLAMERFKPAILYRGADAVTRDRLIEFLDTRYEPDLVLLDHWLLDLAWIADEAVQRQFREWRTSPPRWRPDLYLPPEEYALEAGWELTPTGARRDLYYQECYELVEQSEPPLASSDECFWCGLPFVVAFDLDLRDPNLAFVGLSGERLQLATCAHCVITTPIFMEIDCAGYSAWSNFNLRPAQSAFRRRPVLEDRDAWLSAITRNWSRWAIGERRQTPYEGSAFGMLPTQVGGHPMWVHDAQYPRCPRCHEAMRFLAQVLSFGACVYALICSPCGLAATVHQTT